MIEKYYVPGDEEEPEINLDAENNYFAISGRSIPENANTIFLPVIEWLNNYFKAPNTQTTLNFKLEYLNSSSSKKVTEILLLLEKQYEKGCKIKVHWYYASNDKSMEKKGRGFLSIFNIPFEIIASGE
jgi:hypothetical protein